MGGCWICAKYVYSLVTIELESLFGRLGIEFGSYFVSLGPINMRALPCNRETTWRLVWEVALPWRCSDAGVAAVYGEERLEPCPEDVGTSPNLVKKTSCLGVVLVRVILCFGFMFLGLSLPRNYSNMLHCIFMSYVLHGFEICELGL